MVFLLSCTSCGKTQKRSRKAPKIRGGCGCSGGFKFGGGGKRRNTKHHRNKKIGRKTRRRYLGGGYLNPATFSSDELSSDAYYQPFSKFIGTDTDVTDPANVVDTRLTPQTGGSYLGHLGSNQMRVAGYNEQLPTKVNLSIVSG